jgi:hypothetical protein
MNDSGKKLKQSFVATQSVESYWDCLMVPALAVMDFPTLLVKITLV